MKTIITALSILISLSVFGQPVKPVKPIAIDTNYVARDSFPPIPDSVLSMSEKQMQEAIEVLKNNMSVKQFEKVAEGVDLAYRLLQQIAVTEYNKKRKPIKIKELIKK